MQFYENELVVSEPLLKARERLMSNVGPIAFLGALSMKEQCKFNGEFADNKFSIYKNIECRNLFLPRIIGSFAPHQLGTSIIFRFKFVNYVVLFIMVLCALTLVSMLAGLWPLAAATGWITFLYIIRSWRDVNNLKASFFETFEPVIANKSQERTE